MHMPSLTSLRRMSDSDGESQSKPLSTNSRSWSPLHLSLSSPMTPALTVLKQIPPMQPPEQSCHNSHQRTVRNGIQLPSSPRVSAQSSGTMRSMTRRCWPLSKHWRNGGTSLKVPHINLRSGQTTKPLSTFIFQRNWTDGKLSGLCNWVLIVYSPLMQTREFISLLAQTR